MTVRKEVRTGKVRLVIDIPYRDAFGKKRRYRKDASVQTSTAANAEHRRLLARLGRDGTLESPQPEPPPAAPATVRYDEAVRRFRSTKSKKLKPSTRAGYDAVIDVVLLPRFAAWSLTANWNTAIVELDGELAAEGLSASTRRNVQSVHRSVLRNAVEVGLLEQMPKLPKLPKVGVAPPKPMIEDDVVQLMKVAAPAARVAMALAAYAGLRASEVRGLRWCDVDLRVGEITVRRTIFKGEVSTPKSGNGRKVPIAGPLRALLEVAQRRPHSPWGAVAPNRDGAIWGNHGLQQVFRRAQEKAGLSGFSFHSLRHFFVTELFRRGASAPAVQKLVGHADLAVTQRYADLVDADLKRAVALLDGNGVETA
jgi:integrase